MTTCAQRVALGPQVQTVWLVAIAAAHTGLRHLALQKRSVDVNLVLLLPVGEAEAFGEQRQPVLIVEAAAREAELGTARVARRATLELFRARVVRQVCDAIAGTELPAPVCCFRQPRRKPEITLQAPRFRSLD